VPSSLCVDAPAQADEAVRVMVPGIVVGPVHDREASGIVDHFTASFDSVARVNGTARRDADVVDDLEPARAALDVEGFMHRVGARTVEEARRTRDRRRKIDPGRRRAGVRRRKIHRRSHHARPGRRQEVRRSKRKNFAR
jgi:hypothetical protein